MFSYHLRTTFCIKLIPLTLIALLLKSCIVADSSTLSIIENINPKQRGKTPYFSKETLLLGELTSYRTCFDVHYYNLSVDIDPEKKV